MKPNELKRTLTRCMNAGLPVLIKGQPGVGKSDIVAQVAAELGMNLILSHPVVSDPTDFKGMPAIVNQSNKVFLDVLREIAFTATTKKEFNMKDLFKSMVEPLGKTCDDDGVRAEFLPFGDLYRLVNAEVPTIAFLDDLGQAPACVQAAAMQLILARRVNGHKISDHVVFVAATNRRQDKAGVTGILEPVKSRFATIYELTPDEGDWTEWAFQNNMPGKLIAFAHFRPGLLTSFKPTSDITNSPCPRTFANAGKLINVGLDDIETLSGAVGEGAAVEMMGFFKYWNELPNLTALIADPDKADVPTEPAALYAVVTGLVEKATATNIERIFKYAKRLPKDFSILLGRDCIRRDKDKKIQNTKAFIKWAVDNKDVLTA